MKFCLFYYIAGFRTETDLKFSTNILTVSTVYTLCNVPYSIILTISRFDECIPGSAGLV